MLPNGDCAHLRWEVPVVHHAISLLAFAVGALPSWGTTVLETCSILEESSPCVRNDVSNVLSGFTSFKAMSGCVDTNVGNKLCKSAIVDFNEEEESKTSQPLSIYLHLHKTFISASLAP